MPTPPRRRPKKKAPRRTAPPRRERTKRRRTRAASPAPTLTERPLRGESLSFTESTLEWKVIRRRGRPPRSTLVEARAEHFRLHPLDELGRNRKPLGALQRTKMLWREQSIRVSRRVVSRWLAAARAASRPPPPAPS